jgi:hypothetical protein
MLVRGEQRARFSPTAHRILEVARHRPEIALLPASAPKCHDGRPIRIGHDVVQLDDRHQRPRLSFRQPPARLLAMICRNIASNAGSLIAWS